MGSSAPVIKLRGLTKYFGVGDAEHAALNGVDLTVERGEFIAIMGPSGCGKTTLLNILGLLDRANDGEYELDGLPIEKLSNGRHAHIRSQQIGIIFQNFNLIPRLTVLENVAMPLVYKGMRRVKRLEMASQALRTFHLGEREYYLPWQLSGGQTQRVAIARALVNNPSIILADEPTGNLDSRTSHIIMEELADLHKKGNTIIMVTHNPNLTTYASRVITMLDGQIDTDSRYDRPSAAPQRAPLPRPIVHTARPVTPEPSPRPNPTTHPASNGKASPTTPPPATNQPASPGKSVVYKSTLASASGQPSGHTDPTALKTPATKTNTNSDQSAKASKPAAPRTTGQATTDASATTKPKPAAAKASPATAATTPKSPAPPKPKVTKTDKPAQPDRADNTTHAKAGPDRRPTPKAKPTTPDTTAGSAGSTTTKAAPTKKATATPDHHNAATKDSD